MVHISRQPDEPDRTSAFMIKICRPLGWVSRASFEEDVKRVIEHLENWRDTPVRESNPINQATASWFRYLVNDASC